MKRDYKLAQTDKGRKKEGLKKEDWLEKWRIKYTHTHTHSRNKMCVWRKKLMVEIEKQMEKDK